MGHISGYKKLESQAFETIEDANELLNSKPSTREVVKVILLLVAGILAISGGITCIVKGIETVQDACPLNAPLYLAWQGSICFAVILIMIIAVVLKLKKPSKNTCLIQIIALFLLGFVCLLVWGSVIIFGKSVISNVSDENSISVHSIFFQ